MLEHIHVIPLAAESFGVRSMCTYVETSDARMLLDAGVSLCPKRFGLPPHPKEFKAIDQSRRRISEAARKAELVTISHYHNDHYTPSFEDWLCNWTEANVTSKQVYENKTVLIKDPRDRINYSQRQRGWLFRKTGGKYAAKLESVDGRTFTLGDTVLKFSEPVYHGPENSELGWVVMLTVKFRNERFLFAPDVQGPMSTRTLEIILHEKPQILMLGGPPTYLSPLKVDEHQIANGIKNLERIIEAVPDVILEHHILRDENWHGKIADALHSAYKSGHTLQTAADFVGKKNVFLESMRKRLFDDDHLTEEFEKWTRLSEESKRYTKPPV